MSVMAMPGTSLTEDQIREAAASQVNKFKVPRYVQFVDALPRNANGKILNRTLRKQWHSDTARREELP